jgi:hypothetical protein
MSKPETLTPLLVALRDLQAWFEAGRVDGIVIGGVAASVLGRPRFTRDVDALVLLAEERWHEFLSEGENHNFTPRIDDALKFAQKSRVLLVRHSPSDIDVDIAFALLPFEEKAIKRGVEANVGNVTLRLPRPEDLIIMKAVAQRPRDIIDIEALIDSNPDLDWHRIRRVVREFADALDMPEILDNLEAILARRRKG